MNCSICNKICRKERLINGIQYCCDCDPNKLEKKRRASKTRYRANKGPKD